MDKFLLSNLSKTFLYIRHVTFLPSRNLSKIFLSLSNFPFSIHSFSETNSSSTPSRSHHRWFCQVVGLAVDPRITMRSWVAIRWPLTFLPVWPFLWGGTQQGDASHLSGNVLLAPSAPFDPRCMLLRNVEQEQNRPIRPPQSPRADRDLCAHVRNWNIMNPH